MRAVEENPALHTQSLNPSLSGGESEPVGQLTHVLAPDVEYLAGIQLEQLAEPREALYFPLLHLEQIPPLEPVYPRLHMHPLAAVLPASDVELAGQLIQELFENAPVVVE